MKFLCISAIVAAMATSSAIAASVEKQQHNGKLFGNGVRKLKGKEPRGADVKNMRMAKKGGTEEGECTTTAATTTIEAAIAVLEDPSSCGCVDVEFGGEEDLLNCVPSGFALVATGRNSDAESDVNAQSFCCPPALFDVPTIASSSCEAPTEETSSSALIGVVFFGEDVAFCVLVEDEGSR